MRLDIYVGSLSRYYSNKWDTAIDKYLVDRGLPKQKIQVEDPNGNRRLRADEVYRHVRRWRYRLNRKLQNRLGCSLDWDERLNAPYFTDIPDLHAFYSLILWAAYDIHRDLKRPTVIPTQPEEDPALRRYRESVETNEYRHLMDDISFWLPLGFACTFRASDPKNKTVGFGSSLRLVENLERLNARTWNADQDTLDIWLQSGAFRNASLEVAAQFAMACILRLAKLSVEYSVPMMLVSLPASTTMNH